MSGADPGDGGVLRVVLDTNVLLVSLSSRSPHHWVYRAVAERRVTLCLTTEIALEYEEVVARHLGPDTAASALSFLDIARNVQWSVPPFRWRLVEADPDDDKFADCAVATGATLVTEDGHFGPLRDLDFPPVHVVGLDGFQALLADAASG